MTKSEFETLAKNESRQDFVLYTGTVGMYYFDFCLLGYGIPNFPKSYMYIPKKHFNIICEYSIGRKQDLFKVRVYRNKEFAIKLYKGTTQIAIGKTFYEIKQYLINYKLL